MKVIARPMGTGKTEELLRLAAKDKALVLTDNKSELQSKANEYGIVVQIIDAQDLVIAELEGSSEYRDCKKVYIYKLDDILQHALLQGYGLELCGYTIRTED